MLLCLTVEAGGWVGGWVLAYVVMPVKSYTRILLFRTLTAAVVLKMKQMKQKRRNHETLTWTWTWNEILASTACTLQVYFIPGARARH